MWLPNTSADSLTRPRLAVAFVSAIAAASVGYYAYQNNLLLSQEVSGVAGLRRSNAIRRSRRPRRDRAGSASSTSSQTPGDENVDIYNVPPAGDGETVVDGAADEWWNDPGDFAANQRAGHNIVNLLFRVSEDNARRNGCVHRGCQCNACGMVPIRGVRYRCANCADFDLCETCESQGVHIKTHIFYKIRVPAPPFGPRQMQPVWYTGDPDTCRRSLPRGLIAKLSRDTGFERPELEAFWEQWTFMANAEWREDPDELCVAMDRKTFERCLVPTGASRHAAPNLIHDRMFSFYDSNNDDLIGFAEFLHGLSYRRHKDKLRKVFEGYDIDGDGFVNRRDFLRMFRAYYVLYKQMHKDILDGLEDQLLASTEAQQLVTSRQPLSSLFGREGRVPSADGTMRFEGKTYHRDGTVDIAEGYQSAVIDDRGDNASREDILTSLFACETDQRSRRRFITRSDTDTDWRTVRRLSGTETDRTYWVTLLEPPTSLDELPEILLGNRRLDIEEPEDGSDEDEDEVDENSGEGVRRPNRDSDDSPPATESEARARGISHKHRQAPKLEKRRRDMARKQLHERWKRRQFYLDEEEGGMEPDDWDNDEDILVNINEMAESSKARQQQPDISRSRSSSKVRFVEAMEESETPSDPSMSSRSIPERWGGMGIPGAERDAGKEILYQVTQQAFNELLDTIFKAAEDLAIQAAETKEDREKYREDIEAVELPDEKEEGEKSPGRETVGPLGKAVDDKSLEELLSETGYTVAPEGLHDPAAQDETRVQELEDQEPENQEPENQEPEEPRNAVELDTLVDVFQDERLDSSSSSSSSSSDDEPEYRDPTMPQFKPNSPSTSPNTTSNEPSSKPSTADAPPSPPKPPTLETLRQWKRLTIAETNASERGGWGRLSFDEFEEIYKSQEHQGNRLDYLGSWIDFCIP